MSRTAANDHQIYQTSNTSNSNSNGNNVGESKHKKMMVVICFQIFYLCPTATTERKESKTLISCDLLSDFLSLSNGNNINISYLRDSVVVICFQIFYLCPTATTKSSTCFGARKL